MPPAGGARRALGVRLHPGHAANGSGDRPADRGAHDRAGGRGVGRAPPARRLVPVVPVDRPAHHARRGPHRVSGRRNRPDRTPRGRGRARGPRTQNAGRAAPGGAGGSGRGRRPRLQQPARGRARARGTGRFSAPRGARGPRPPRDRHQRGRPGRRADPPTARVLRQGPVPAPLARPQRPHRPDHRTLAADDPQEGPPEPEPGRAAPDDHRRRRAVAPGADEPHHQRRRGDRRPPRHGDGHHRGPGSGDGRRERRRLLAPRPRAGSSS